MQKHMLADVQSAPSQQVDQFDIMSRQSLSHPMFQTVIDGVCAMSMFGTFLFTCVFSTELLEYNFIALPLVMKLIAGQIYLSKV